MEISEQYHALVNTGSQRFNIKMIVQFLMNLFGIHLTYFKLENTIGLNQ